MVGLKFLALAIPVRIRIPQRILKINIMWQSKKVKPTKEGCYVVAEFRNNKLIDFSANYCYAKDIADELIKSCPSETVNFTHWMHYSDYKKMLENLPKNE